MKKLHVFIVGILGLLLLTGCAGANLSQHINNDVTQTSVVLSQDNYRIIGEVSGEATSTYILGIGGLSKKALTNNSRADMYAKAKLKDGQAIINVSTTVSVKVIAGPIYMKYIATTTGYVIEFTK
ncbi:MAG TPA: hypothetical protein P5564_04560 [Paludibacteraceae bacterium]|nr:hypothetical protein [Paludibacteraceae bacterium]HRS67863.1 hypothetical protein [Paludibacteraceae bacterium]